MKDFNRKGRYIVLAESTKQDLQEMTEMLKSLDSIGMIIIKTSATALLARQELAESKAEKQANGGSIVQQEGGI